MFLMVLWLILTFSDKSYRRVLFDLILTELWRSDSQIDNRSMDNTGIQQHPLRQENHFILIIAVVMAYKSNPFMMISKEQKSFNESMV